MLKIVKGGFILNGEKVTKLVGRSAFKLPNVLTYVYTGDGGGDKGWNSLKYASRYCNRQQELFGEHCVLRVLHETGGWDPNSKGMFGSAPSDQGTWQRNRLRDGRRETGLHRVGNKTLEWLFKTSHETGIAFEVVIDSTLKHDNIPAGEIDHVIRQVGIRMGGLSEQYQKALIIPNVRNEWNAHNESGHSLADVNMWAVRWHRDDYTSKDMRPIVCPGGGDEFTYDVGPEASKFAMGLIHPDRGDDWWTLPNMGKLRTDARGMPVGFNESMYFVKPKDKARARDWYRHPGGWTSDFRRYTQFAEAALDHCDYFIFHDEDGTGVDTTRTADASPLESHFGSGNIPPPPPAPDPDPPPTEITQLDRIEAKLDTVLDKACLLRDVLK